MLKIFGILLAAPICQLVVSFIGAFFNISGYYSGYYAGVLSTAIIVFILIGVGDGHWYIL